jgi:hypothetical protein
MWTKIPVNRTSGYVNRTSVICKALFEKVVVYLEAPCPPFALQFFPWYSAGIPWKKIKIKIKTPGGFYTPIRLSWSGWARPC